MIRAATFWLVGSVWHLACSSGLASGLLYVARFGLIPAPRGCELEVSKADLEDDLLYGAKAIAKALGCRSRRVYHLAERGRMPIWNEPGIGLVARRSSLEAYFKNREQQALERDGK